MVFVVKCPNCGNSKNVPTDRKAGFRCCGVEFGIKAFQIGQSVKRTKSKAVEIPFDIEEPKDPDELTCDVCHKPESANCPCT